MAEKGCLTIYRLKCGPLPLNEVGRISEEEERRKGSFNNTLPVSFIIIIINVILVLVSILICAIIICTGIISISVNSHLCCYCLY